MRKGGWYVNYDSPVLNDGLLLLEFVMLLEREMANASCGVGELSSFTFSLPSTATMRKKLFYFRQQ